MAIASSLRREIGGGEIWLFGGGQLFAELLTGNQVYAVEVTIVPVLLGGGVPMLAPTSSRTTLALMRSHVYAVSLGGGKRLFPAGRRLGLTLVESSALPTGVVYLRYRRAAET